jgi:hypothetical protein
MPTRPKIPSPVDHSLSRPVFYLVDWLPPDFGAVGQYAEIFARKMAIAGRSVYLFGLTSAEGTTAIEEFAGTGRLEIRRLHVEAASKTHYLSRLLWAFKVNLRLISAFLTHKNAHGAALIFTGSPPFMLFFAIPAKWLADAQLRYRITDFYPEVIIADRAKPSAALSVLSKVTWWLRRRVDRFEVLGGDQQRILLRAGIPAHRIELKRDPSPIEIKDNEVPCRKPVALQGRLVLLYSGNFGVVHEYETVLEGYRLHHREGSGRFALWLNASGVNADRLEYHLQGDGLPYGRTRPGPLSALPGIMAAADAHLITLREAFAGYVLPSKVYACIASRRPILFVGPAASDVHSLCDQSDVRYEHVRPGDALAFAAALARLADAISITRSAQTHAN